MSETGQTDKQYDGQLIDTYAMLKRIKEIALKGDTAETEKAINNEMKLIKLKSLPNYPTDTAARQKIKRC